MRWLFNRNFDELLSSSFTLWIISITSAILMWIYVIGMEESTYITRKFSCPLEYMSLDAQAILRGRVSEVDVELRGPEQEMLRLDYNSVVAYVDARNLAPGKRYTVDVEVNTPMNISLVSCVPSQIVLDLARQVTRLMTIETALPQNIPEGQYIEGVEIIPREVGVRGAEDDVAKIGALRITPTLEELQSGREHLMPVKFSQSEPFLSSVVIEPAQVRFRGTLVRGLPRKRVPVNARFSGELNPDYEVRSVIKDPSEIQIEGEAEAIALVDVVETENIDISLLESDQTLVVPLRQPDVEGVTLSAGSVRVTLQLSETRAERKLSNVPVEIRGTDDPSVYIASPSGVSVTIEGRPSLIESLSPDEVGISTYVDMSNIFMTPVTLPVRSELLSGDAFRITRIEPQNVTINSLGRN